MSLDCAVGTYIDNQAAVGYPINYVCRQWEQFKTKIIFTSDDENAEWLLAALRNDWHESFWDFHVISLGIHITQPSDLMTVWQAVTDHLRDSGCRYICRQEADLVFTDVGLKYVAENLGKSMCIPARECKLYCETYDNPVGAVILKADGYHKIGPNTDHEVILTEGTDHNHDRWPLQGGVDERLMLGLSYFDTGTYARKEAHHVKLWPDQEKRDVVAAFARSRAEGIRAALPKIRRESGGTLKPIAYAGQWKKVIDDLGLVDDMNAVMDVIR